MKGLCTVSTAGVVNILMSGDELPEVGRYYNLEDAVEGTAAQNKTFHALTTEYFNSGLHSYNADSYEDFKKQIKRHLGEGFESYVYVDMLEIDGYGLIPKMFDAKNKKDIPEHVLSDINMRNQVRGKLKSWSCYTKKQRQNCIDNVISEMLQCEINTAKFQEIMKGLEK